LLLDFLFMFGIGVQEFGLILVVALLVFGPKKLPELARMLGRGMGEFRRASNDLRQSLALDDLQNDLRKDLHSAQSMLKPDLKSILKTDPADDRPPQAGDEVDPHPGELPLGNDHEHHPEPTDESTPKASGAGASSVAPSDTSLGTTATTATDATDATDTSPNASATDASNHEPATTSSSPSTRHSTEPKRG